MRINKMKKRRFIVTLILLFIIGTAFFSLGFKKCETIKYAYRENNSVNYRVFLKENNFFEAPYLEKNKTYITSLIDYINADFSYNISFDERVTGPVYYKLIAEIRADKANNDVGNYWTKKYELKSQEISNINNKDSHVINVSETIDYNKYNDLLNSFISEYGVQAESTLRISLVVEGTVKGETTNQNMEIDSEVSLVVPLSKLAIEGKIETESNNNEKEVVKKVEEVQPFRKFFRVLFVIDLIMFLYNFIQYIRFLLTQNDNLSYRDKIKKINNDYEEIITKVKTVNTEDFAVIDVEAFDDLINVYNSIREPINFLYGNDESKFFIIKGNTCYMYTISKEERK